MVVLFIKYLFPMDDFHGKKKKKKMLVGLFCSWACIFGRERGKKKEKIIFIIHE